MMFPIPPPVEAALRRLEQAGHEAYIVGGCVRDIVRGVLPHDWDITTSALPEQVKTALAGSVIHDTGIQHGTVTAIVNGMPLEITTYRVDGAYSDSRHPDAVAFTRNLRDDLQRRDFTINAMAYSPLRGFADPFSGREDIARALVRCVGDPKARLTEDALRIMRALRFASVLGFAIAPDTARALHAEAQHLRAIAVERIAKEFALLLSGAGVFAVLRDFADIIAVFIPEIVPMFGFEQNNPHHIYDVWTHTLHAVRHAETELRLAAFFHDIGKPHCYTVDAEGVGHFHGHPEYGAQLSARIVKRLRFDRETQSEVETLVRLHDLPNPPEIAALKRRLSRYGVALFDKLLRLQLADTRAQNPAYSRIEALEKARQLVAEIVRSDAVFSLRQLALKGDDLLAKGYRGRAIGDALDALLQSVISGQTENEREALFRRLEELRPTGQ